MLDECELDEYMKRKTRREIERSNFEEMLKVTEQQRKEAEEIFKISNFNKPEL